jgi:DnaK suppressor protein
MDKARREKYRRRLEQEQVDLRALLSRTGQAGRSADEASPEDVAEKAANSYNKEFLFHQSDNERTHLYLVEEALKRLQVDSFGACQECGDVIDQKRLDAVPWAAYCRSCQEQEERESKSNAQ